MVSVSSCSDGGLFQALGPAQENKLSPDFSFFLSGPPWWPGVGTDLNRETLQLKGSGCNTREMFENLDAICYFLVNFGCNFSVPELPNIG